MRQIKYSDNMYLLKTNLNRWILFCDGVPIIDTAEKISVYKGIPLDKISIFCWRGNGWSEPTHIETNNSESCDSTYEKLWHGKDVH